jgi:uncharacterized membrane protein YhaH (DUF805 family)
MNWAQTLFNPTGESPRLHFTRAWTALFVAQLLVVILPVTTALVLDLAGGDGSSVKVLGLYASPIVFIVTTLMSYVIHSRRLNDAGKPQLLAVIPLIPLLIGFALFFVSVGSTATQYDKQFEMRQEYRANPDAFQEKQREQRAEAQRQAEASGEESGNQQDRQRRGRGGPGGPGQGFDQPLPSKSYYVIKRAAPNIQNVIIPLSALIAIWSLMWVARVPFFGRYPGGEKAA